MPFATVAVKPCEILRNSLRKTCETSAKRVSSGAKPLRNLCKPCETAVNPLRKCETAPLSVGIWSGKMHFARLHLRVDGMVDGRRQQHEKQCARLPRRVRQHGPCACRCAVASARFGLHPRRARREGGIDRGERGMLGELEEITGCGTAVRLRGCKRVSVAWRTGEGQWLSLSPRRPLGVRAAPTLALRAS